MIQENHKLFKVNQNAVIVSGKGEILILKKDGRWMLPGGRLEADEDWLQGLRRELNEETGIKGFEMKEILNVDVSSSNETYNVTFLCGVEGTPQITLSNEHRDYAWLSADAMDKYEFLNEKLKERLKTILERRYDVTRAS